MREIRKKIWEHILPQDGSNETVFRAFLLLWTLAYFLHNSLEWRNPSLGWLSLGLCGIAWLLPFPRLSGLLCFLLALPDFWEKIPSQANHSNFFLFVSIWLVALGFLQRRSLDLPKIGATMLASLWVVYFWAVIHKLNFDFFNPEVSCAGEITQDFFTLVGWGKVPLALTRFLPYAAIGIEAAIASLLLFPGSRRLGLFLSAFLHCFLAPIAFLDFGSVVLSIHFMFLFSLAESNQRAKAYPLLLGYVLFQLSLSLLSYFWRDSDLLYGAQSLALTLFWFFLLGKFCPQKPPWKKISFSLPVLLLLFGSTNYLGLNTAGNFSMFSNIQTEGEKWNHFFLPRWLKLFSYQDKIVWVQAIDEDFLGTVRKHPAVGLGIPELELFRLYKEWGEDGDFPQTFLIYKNTDWKDENIVPATSIYDPKKKPFNWWEFKFLYFREIQPLGANQCRW